MPGLPAHHQLLEFTQMHVDLVGIAIHHLILYCPLLLLPSIMPSIRVFSNESALRIRWPKYWSFNFNISPSKEHPRLISFRMDWLDLLAVQGTLKSLLQHRSSKASVLQCSAFFIVQLSHPYMTTGKTINLTIQTFVDKVYTNQKWSLILTIDTYTSVFMTALFIRIASWKQLKQQNVHINQLWHTHTLKLYTEMKNDEL